MEEDFFVVDIPVFVPVYDANKRYGWSKYKDNLWKLLSETTGGYCMYCYDSIRKGKILIQPFEAQKQENGHSLRLQYDLLKGKYIPSKKYREYDEEEIEIIREHIKIFGLNTSERRNLEVGKYCKNVIDNESIMQSVEYNNLVVDLFRNKLQCLDIKEAVKVCQVIYKNSFLKLDT